MITKLNEDSKCLKVKRIVSYQDNNVSTLSSTLFLQRPEEKNSGLIKSEIDSDCINNNKIDKDEKSFKIATNNILLPQKFTTGPINVIHLLCTNY